MLERSALKKSYTIDMRELGWRTAELFVSVNKGNTDRIAERLLAKPNVLSASIRVGDPDINVAAEIFFRSTEDLHAAVEDAKALPNVASVEWSEYVKLYTKKQNCMLNTIFGMEESRPTKAAKA